MYWPSNGNKEPDKNKQLHILSVKEYEELSEKLTKYKRAFEILKQIVQLNYEEDEFFCNEQYYLHSDANILLEKEEYELLEELMKDGKIN